MGPFEKEYVSIAGLQSEDRYQESGSEDVVMKAEGSPEQQSFHANHERSTEIPDSVHARMQAESLAPLVPFWEHKLMVIVSAIASGQYMQLYYEYVQAKLKQAEQ